MTASYSEFFRQSGNNVFASSTAISLIAVARFTSVNGSFDDGKNR